MTDPNQPPNQPGDGKDEKKKRNPWGASEPPRTIWNNPNNSGGGPRGPNPGKSDLDDLLKSFQEKLNRIFGGGGGSNRLVILGLVAVFALWLLSGFYFIQSNENGVVLTLGKYTKTDEQPGLKYRMPWPFETVNVVDVTQERRLQVGYADDAPPKHDGSVNTADDSLMLTGDENIIDINFVVLWRINNAKEFLFSLRDPEDTIKLVASSAMREVIGQTDIQSALTDGRTKVQDDTRVLMQKILDEYKSGITINNVQLQKVDPPGAVVDAFNEVQRARQDQVRAKNQAQAYSNSILPVAKGESSKLIQQAEAYKQEVINRATGDAARFNAVYTAYKQGPSVTAERMYLETMEDVLKNARTIVIGSSNGANVLPWLSLQDKSAPAKPDAAPVSASPDPQAAANSGEVR